MGCSKSLLARVRGALSACRLRVAQGLGGICGGRGVVSHAGLVLLRHLADKAGLTGGLSAALTAPRIMIHDRGRVLADLACAIADGACDLRFPGDGRSAGAVRAGDVGADRVADVEGNRLRRRLRGQAGHRCGECRNDVSPAFRTSHQPNERSGVNTPFE